MDGKFEWCDETYSPYRSWCPGQPIVDEAMDITCVAYLFDSNGQNGCFQVEDCAAELPIYCQKERCDEKSKILEMLNVHNKATKSVSANCKSCLKQ